MSTIDFHSLAKTELHCHLDGSLSLPTIRQLAAMANIDLPASDEELKHHLYSQIDASHGQPPIYDR